jgi:hypothetical protein
VIALFAQLARAGVADGHAAYAAGDLDGAIAALGGPDASGVRAYGHGTALLAAGRPVEALPPLLLAARQRPRDPNVAHNLALARSRIAEGEGAPPPPPAGPRLAIAAVATPAELAALALLAAVGAAVAAWRRARVGVGMAGALVAGAALAIAGAAVAWRTDAAHPLAVVVSPAPLRDTPDPLARSERALPPGSEVRVVRPWGPFVLVEDGRGRQGWVAEDALARAW